MNGFLADIRHALRVYGATPVPTLIGMLVLALAVGSISAFLSLYNDLQLASPAGFEQSGGLVSVGQTDGRQFTPFSLDMIERFGEEVASLDALAGVLSGDTLMIEPGRERAPVEYVSHGFFEQLRPRVRLGRGFDARDHAPGAEPVTVISDRFWRQHFDSRPEAIGETVRITGRVRMVAFDPDNPPTEPPEETTEHRIVGVMGPALTAVFGDAVALWLPYEQAAPRYVAAGDTMRSAMAMFGLARLAGDATPTALAAELNTRYADAEDLGIPSGLRFDAAPGILLDIERQRETARQVRLFLAGSLLLGLVAASNMSLFLLSRAPGRRHELGIRMAVGAPLRRLARQLATEAALLVLVATLLGLAMSLWLTVFLRDLAFLRPAQWQDVTTLDWRVLISVAAVALLLAALVSLAPALELRQLGIYAGSRATTARAGVAQRIAATAQIAIAGTLAGVALALGWYLASIVTSDPGYVTTDRYVVSLTMPDGPWGMSMDPDTIRVERERRRSAVLALPGVESVGFGTSIPGRPATAFGVQLPRHDDSEMLHFGLNTADSGYLDVLGLRLVSGQALDEADAGTMLVNETLARAVWGRTDVVGEVLPYGVMTDSTEVMGVLEDVSFRHPFEAVEPMGWLPLLPAASFEHILVRSTTTSAELRAMLARLIDDGVLELDIASVERLDEVVARWTAADRARTVLAASSAVLVVVLAAFGFYGTQRYLVMAGRREYAIRAAVGAGPRALGRHVFARSLMMGLPGLLLGGALAFTLVNLLRDDFFPHTVAAGPVALIVVAGIAVLVLAATAAPARQARETQPAPLLKEE